MSDIRNVFYLILIIIQQSKYYYSYFRDEKTKVQNCYLIASAHMEEGRLSHPDHFMDSKPRLFSH